MPRRANYEKMGLNKRLLRIDQSSVDLIAFQRVVTLVEPDVMGCFFPIHAAFLHQNFIHWTKKGGANFAYFLKDNENNLPFSPFSTKRFTSRLPDLHEHGVSFSRWLRQFTATVPSWAT